MDKAKEALPQTTPVFNKYAIALRKSGDVKKCIKQYKKCLNACPDHPVYMFNLARAQVDAGENKAAQKLLNRILEARPNFKEAQDLLKQTS